MSYVIAALCYFALAIPAAVWVGRRLEVVAATRTRRAQHRRNMYR